MDTYGPLKPLIIAKLVILRYSNSEKDEKEWKIYKKISFPGFEPLLSKRNFSTP